MAGKLKKALAGLGIAALMLTPNYALASNYLTPSRLEQVVSNFDINRINNTAKSELDSVYQNMLKKYSKEYAMAYNVAKENHISPSLLMGLITIEAGLNKSYKKGDSFRNHIDHGSIKGLGQISYKTWDTYGKGYNWKDMDDDEANLEVAVRVLKKYSSLFNGDVVKGVEAYNSGPYAYNKAWFKLNDKDLPSFLEKLTHGTKKMRENAYYPRAVLETAWQIHEILEKNGIKDEVNYSPKDFVNLPRNDQIPGWRDSKYVEVKKGDSLWKIAHNTDFKHYVVYRGNEKTYSGSLDHMPSMLNIQPGDVIELYK